MIPDRMACIGLFLVCVLATAGALLPRHQFCMVLVLVGALLVALALAAAALAYLDGAFWDRFDSEDHE